MAVTFVYVFLVAVISITLAATSWPSKPVSSPADVAAVETPASTVAEQNLPPSDYNGGGDAWRPPFLWAPFNHMFNPMVPYWTFANEMDWLQQMSRQRGAGQSNAISTSRSSDGAANNDGNNSEWYSASYPCYPILSANLPVWKKSQRFRAVHRCNGLYKCSNGRDESDCPQKCLEPLYTPEMYQRDCKQSKLRYQYNADTKQCDFFVYGGCVEKRNMFMKKSECERECVRFIEAPGDRSVDDMKTLEELPGFEDDGHQTTQPIDVETAEPAVKLIEGTIPCSSGNAGEMIYYNETDKCNGFYDCPNGDDERYCMSKCLGFRYTKQADILDCRASIPRWHYDFETQQCVFFYYGGCAVVHNSFLTKDECERECTGIYVNRTWASLPSPVGTANVALNSAGVDETTTSETSKTHQTDHEKKLLTSSSEQHMDMDVDNSQTVTTEKPIEKDVVEPSSNVKL